MFDANPGTLTSLVFTNSSGGQPGLYNIRINGQVLVDGVNNSYGANGFMLDFSDPDDLGADRSGNENNFTASGGFVTERPANYTFSQAGSETVTHTQMKALD